RPRRALALLAGIVAATTGFVVLSGSATTSQVRTTGTVAANYRAAYDVLVRPQGARAGAETEQGLVRPNYLTGVYGGITTAQLDRVRRVANVEVAAPIAMLGYTYVPVTQTVDLTGAIDPSARTQIFRLSPTWTTDRGLTVIDDAPRYVYVTSNRLYPEKEIVGLQPPGPVFGDGTRLAARPFPLCYFTVLEVRPDGRKVPMCAGGLIPDRDGTTATERSEVSFVEAPRGTSRLVVTIRSRTMVPAAAIDPAAEAALVGLDHAVVSGRYLRAGEMPVRRPPNTRIADQDLGHLAVPALVADRSYVDQQVRVSVQRLEASAAAVFPGKDITQSLPALAKKTGEPVDPQVRVSPATQPIGDGADLGLLYQPGAPSYDRDTGRLRPRPLPGNPKGWRVALDGGGEGTDLPPAVALDVGFRPLRPPRAPLITLDRYPRADIAGEFDPERLRAFSPLSAVPLETYRVSGVPAADDRSRRLLGDRPLLPTGSPLGYLSAPPLILTTVAALDAMPLPAAQQAAPISAVRVRVGGVTGMDPLSRERVRLVAQDIAVATGLDVDIMIGSSPAQQAVELPAGRHGRPALTLTEPWSRKGVAVAIVQAADRKGVLLSGLVLLVCVLFLGNAVAAAVRDRRREMGILACLGWPAGRLAAAIMGEVAVVGLAGGVFAGAAALPLAYLAGVSISVRDALLAVPIGLAIAVLAAIAPAVSGARAAPGEALQPAVRVVRRARHHRTLLGQALIHLVRVPGR
ncbi:FtsX-like permease family protein, partial [Actinoplanes sp. NPDC051633]|uniref:FtsX-like permease family protein n=1 Tax=Actinoplanes sp. NPDC051633 TaxID=3155670 RepID=UPI0034273D01